MVCHHVTPSSMWEQLGFTGGVAMFLNQKSEPGADMLEDQPINLAHSFINRSSKLLQRTLAASIPCVSEQSH